MPVAASGGLWRSPPASARIEAMSRARSLSESGALVTSALLHLALVAGGAWLLHRSLAQHPSQPATDATPTIDVVLSDDGLELPPMSAGGVAGPSDPVAEPVLPVVSGAFGGERPARPDIPEPGRGGSAETREAALNLADSVDGLSLDRDPMNRLDRSQLQRLRTGAERETRDDRRATPNPMELSFLVSGHGKLALRREPAPRDPSRGTSAGGVARERGATLGGPEIETGTGPEPEPGGSARGGEKHVTALGVAGGSIGRDYRRSASVMLARPMVTRGRAAVPAAVRGRPSDNVDSTQDVANAVASMIHASTGGGRSGTGPGGERGPGAPASGGAGGPGSRSAAAGSGPGALTDVGADAGVIGYFRRVTSKVEPYWRSAFPDWAIAEGRSGLAVVSMSIRRDGTLASVSLERSSGVSEFDRNVVEAVRRAAPFGPLPAKLLPGPQPLKMTFDATNPAVGRDGPGRGQRGGS